MDNQEEKPIYDKPVIGITIGDVNGVGPEIIIKALSDTRLLNYIIPVVYGSTKVMAFYRKMLRANDFNYTQVKQPGRYSQKKANVVNCWEQMVEINVGQVTSEAGIAAFRGLEKAVEDLKEGLIDAIVTAPINKSNIQQENFNFPGHTEYLAERFESKDFLMMMVGEQLRVGVVTAHIPIKEVASTLTPELIKQKLKIMYSSLRKDFNIVKPKIAVLGLNPHAGDNGLLGDEEEQLIKPVIDAMKEKGMLIYGPYPADGFFGAGTYKNFDGIMAMYHDQGLTPFKVIEFESGVNYTAGLPMIRTSPDHGTGYNIAGKSIASEKSLKEAIYLARDIVYQRSDKKIEVSA